MCSAYTNHTIHLYTKRVTLPILLWWSLFTVVVVPQGLSRLQQLISHTNISVALFIHRTARHDFKNVISYNFSIRHRLRHVNTLRCPTPINHVIFYAAGIFSFCSTYFLVGVFAVLLVPGIYASTWFAYLDSLAFGVALSHCLWPQNLCISRTKNQDGHWECCWFWLWVERTVQRADGSSTRHHLNMLFIHCSIRHH